MNPIEIFIKRLQRIGIHAEFIGNYPWVYLDKVNGKKVKGTYEANHGFTAFWMPVDSERPIRMSDISIVFKKIRETLNQEDE